MWPCKKKPVETPVAKANPLDSFRHVVGGCHDEYVCDSCHQTWLPGTYEFFRAIVIDAVCPKCGKEATQRLHLVRHEWDESDTVRLEDTDMEYKEFKEVSIPGHEVIHWEWPAIIPGAKPGDVGGPHCYYALMRNKKTVILQSYEWRKNEEPNDK